MGKRKAPELPGTPAWMMTFSDITTLLLTFFILMLTFSTMETEKFEKAAGSFQGAFGVVRETIDRERPMIESRRLNLPDRVRGEGAESPRRLDPEKLATELHSLVEGEGVELDKVGHRWRVRLPNANAFQPGRSSVRRRIIALYRTIARRLTDYPNVIVLEGHTDNAFTPTSRFKTPWDLGGARASSVAMLFRREGFPEEQISLRSYGASRPEVPNDTVMRRARNRRVSILILAPGEE